MSLYVRVPIKTLTDIVSNPKNGIRAVSVDRVTHSVKYLVDPPRVSVEDACRQIAKWQPELFHPDSSVRSFSSRSEV